MVYADQAAVNDKLVRQMLEATDHPAAFAAFASILFAPRAHTDFGENLIRSRLYSHMTRGSDSLNHQSLF
jgi:hypothetical protein